MQFNLASKLTLAAIACALTMCVPSLVEAEEAQLYDAAKREGNLTWYISHVATELAEKIGREFTAKHPGVSVNVVRSTNAVIWQRLNQDLKVRAQNCDVYSGTEIGQYIELKSKGLLLQYASANAAKLSPDLTMKGSDGYYQTTSAGLIGLGYNSDRVAEGDRPKDWPDLLDPKFKDRVALGHPGFSGYVGIWVIMMQKLYGWNYFEKMNANNPQIGRSIQDALTNIVSGERTVGAVSLPEFIVSKRRGNPVDVAYPTTGTVLLVNPSGILKDSKNPNAAKLFIEYLMSFENNQSLAKDYQPSIRDDVEPPPGMKSMKDIKLIRPQDEEITKGLIDVRTLWRKTFGV
jgi:iron(III) transport system substrate-binding protein